MEPKMPSFAKIPKNEQEEISNSENGIDDQIEGFFDETNTTSEPDVHEKIKMQVAEAKEISEKTKEEIEKQIESQGIEVGDYIEIIFDNDLDNELFVKQGPTKFKGFDGISVRYSYYHPNDGSYVTGGTNADKVNMLKLAKKSEDSTAL
jgi:hypothetical protein